ncbi:hypothetical protein [Thauera sp.]|uniref:hypothetical protein n=1 Tax=Thauera sp. TaxID=1905334 RepID=UPI002BF58C50|nr:hypothetical protein [Thauera sp.]HRP26388.1 hypothetical protein [Thauera sp.]
MAILISDQRALRAAVEDADPVTAYLNARMAENVGRYRAAAAAVASGSDRLALVRMTGATYAKEGRQ